ncbi:5'-nucleotidase, lipoprotein e(P4) family [Fodinibius salsisoli]|uniref:Acid phosphatase n=1 Tax=Fodinibius salsisoli TaxID=2820877 RepID=A0ABT3PKB3_9BACT|nr:HAD family acid phosphatase [Fodinibius salsisoli]MCW9706198.1 hypothetical protein [Fodinibius salsisoli]
MWNTFIRRKLLLFLVIILTQISCHSSNVLQHPTTSATLWVQNAAEYKALTTTIYKMASNHLEKALNDSAWTAETQQPVDSVATMEPAIIVDVDETVLNNAPFQARMIKQQSAFDPEAWNDWVIEAQADPVPGALSFLKKADQHGIAIFYITNREAAVEEGTQRNLEKLGFPLSPDKDRILSKNEQPDWTSSKVNRRAKVAANYRILMLVGDDLNDFLSAKDIPQQKREQLIDEYSEYWGQKWFVLPNPTYGSWEDALFNFDDNLTNREEKERKIQQLETKN